MTNQEFNEKYKNYLNNLKMKIKLNQEFIDSDDFVIWTLFFTAVFVISVVVLLMVYTFLIPYFIGIISLSIIGTFLKNIIKIEK